MARLEDLTEESFNPHLDSIFKAKLGEGKFQDLKLAEIKSGKRLSDTQVCFSLIFKDEARNCLQQRIYELEHTTMGDLSLFLVPVGAHEKGYLYQAVFNRP